MCWGIVEAVYSYLQPERYAQASSCMLHDHTIHASEVFLQGLDVVFDALLCMRQAHGFAFGKSDLFMLCSAKLDTLSQHSLDDSGRPRIVPCNTVRLMGVLCSVAVQSICCSGKASSRLERWNRAYRDAMHAGDSRSEMDAVGGV